MLGVLCVHLSWAFYPIKLLWWGKCGVQMFFVISGYLACNSFENNVVGGGCGAYYMKRALRILPSYYVALLLSLLYYSVIEQTVPLSWDWLRYFLGLNYILPATTSTWTNMNGFWCMSSFICFYAAVPYVVRRIRTFRMALLWCSITIVLSCCLVGMKDFVQVFEDGAHNESFKEQLCSSSITGGPVSMMWYFLLGIWANVAIREGKERLLLLLLCIAQVVIVIALATWQQGAGYAVNGIVAFATAQIILLSHQETEWMSERTKKVIHFISKYSFYVYLAHGLMINVAKDGAAILCDAAGAKSMVLSCFFFAVIFITGVILLCALMEFIQRACITLNRRVL